MFRQSIVLLTLPISWNLVVYWHISVDAKKSARLLSSTRCVPTIPHITTDSIKLKHIKTYVIRDLSFRWKIFGIYKWISIKAHVQIYLCLIYRAATTIKKARSSLLLHSLLTKLLTMIQIAPSLRTSW
jgi:hypothetical protein